MGIGANAINSQEGSTVVNKQRMLVQAFSILVAIGFITLPGLGHSVSRWLWPDLSFDN